MKKLFLFIYNIFKKWYKSESFAPNLSSQSVYRTAAKKSELEEIQTTTEPLVEKNYPTLSELFSQKKGGMPSLSSSSFSPMTPLPPLPPLAPLAPLPPLDPLPPLKIRRTNDYSPVKNLNTKQIIQAKRISREDALRLSHLPLTNDMTKVGDDTVHIPLGDGQILHITPKYSESDTYKVERDKFTTFINEIIERHEPAITSEKDK